MNESVKDRDFGIKIYVKGIQLEINITSRDPANLLLIAAAIIEAIKRDDMEPTVEIQP